MGFSTAQPISGLYEDHWEDRASCPWAVLLPGSPSAPAAKIPALRCQPVARTWHGFARAQPGWPCAEQLGRGWPASVLASPPTSALAPLPAPALVSQDWGTWRVRGHHQLGKVSGRPAPGAAGEALGAGKKCSGLQTLQRCRFRFPSPWGAAFPKGFSISGSHTMRFPFGPSPGRWPRQGHGLSVGAVGSRRGHTAAHSGKAPRGTPQIPLSPNCSDSASGLTPSQCPQSPTSLRISWGCVPGGSSHGGMMLFWMAQPAAKVLRCSAQDRCGMLDTDRCRMLSTRSVRDARHRAVQDARHRSGSGSGPGHRALLCTCLHITKSHWLQQGPVPPSPNLDSNETITPPQAPMRDQRVPGQRGCTPIHQGFSLAERASREEAGKGWRATSGKHFPELSDCWRVSL